MLPLQSTPAKRVPSAEQVTEKTLMMFVCVQFDPEFVETKIPE
jgi:hypothetical protein